MFLVFAGHEGDEHGGWFHKKNEFFNEPIAIKYAEGIVSDYDWVHVVDVDVGQIIWKGQR